MMVSFCHPMIGETMTNPMLLHMALAPLLVMPNLQKNRSKENSLSPMRAGPGAAWLAMLWRVRGRDQCGFVASVVLPTSTRPTLPLRR